MAENDYLEDDFGPRSDLQSDEPRSRISTNSTLGNMMISNSVAQRPRLNRGSRARLEFAEFRIYDDETATFSAEESHILRDTVADEDCESKSFEASFPRYGAFPKTTQTFGYANSKYRRYHLRARRLPLETLEHDEDSALSVLPSTPLGRNKSLQVGNFTTAIDLTRMKESTEPQKGSLSRQSWTSGLLAEQAQLNDTLQNFLRHPGSFLLPSVTPKQAASRTEFAIRPRKEKK
ncbi:hypothetical protein BP6252_05740 [Coleophoma cylindrospora]|uniref:Uncharacterized protein n=1 Tax=Coleophoma cylindrospora TaxID=1849047 RepID=A0A3D8RUC6_9HELO|nr:hypothetical protein BP6252_05740 [Coleophoma cylindrospora]